MKKLSLSLLLYTFLTWSSCISEPIEKSPYGSKIPVGNSIPEFSVVTLNQDTVSRDNRDAETLVILFFHTKCGDCQKELPVVEQVYRDCRQDSLWQLICIGRSEDAATVNRYWQQKQFTMPVSPQPDRLIYERFAYSGVPMLYVVNGRNIIRAVFDDQNMATYEELKGWILKVNEENQKDKS